MRTALDNRRPEVMPTDLVRDLRHGNHGAMFARSAESLSKRDEVAVSHLLGNLFLEESGMPRHLGITQRVKRIEVAVSGRLHEAPADRSGTGCPRRGPLGRAAGCDGVLRAIRDILSEEAKRVG